MKNNNCKPGILMQVTPVKIQSQINLSHQFKNHGVKIDYPE
jgi:hypothetical protein